MKLPFFFNHFNTPIIIARDIIKNFYLRWVQNAVKTLAKRRLEKNNKKAVITKDVEKLLYAQPIRLHVAGTVVKFFARTIKSN